MTSFKQGRRMLPWKRRGQTWKLRINGHKFHLHSGEYADGTVGEIFIDAAKAGAFMRHALHTIAQLTSLCLQHGCPLAKLVKAFVGQEFEPRGKVDGHERIVEASSIVDLVFRVLTDEYPKSKEESDGKQARMEAENMRAEEEARTRGAGLLAGERCA